MPDKFTRWDGADTAVDCLSCCRCKNYFWVQTEQNEIEHPKFCPWCGLKFSDSRNVGPEEMGKTQIL